MADSNNEIPFSASRVSRQPSRYYNYILRISLSLQISVHIFIVESQKGINAVSSVPLSIRRALLLYKIYGGRCYGVSTYLVINRISSNSNKALLAVSRGYVKFHAPSCVVLKGLTHSERRPKNINSLEGKKNI